MKLSRTGRIVAASAVLPALLLSTGGAALAATDSLTLTVLNRSGAKVAIWATAVNIDSSQQYSIKAGTAKKLPKGTYAVLTQIVTGETTTLGGTTVKVAGSAKLTVDARQGKRVGLSLNPAAPTGFNAQLSARVCSQTGASYNVETTSDQIYAIPTTSKTIGFAALGSWSDLSGTTDSYAVLNQTTGVPSNPTRTYSRSALGTVTVDSRRGPGGSNFSDVAVQPVAKGCGSELYAEMISSDAPTSSKLHLSPTTWDIRSDEFATVKKTGESADIGGYMTNRTVAAGKAYSVRFYAAGWGPGTLLPYLSGGTLNYNMNDGFEDPAYPTGGWSVEGGDKATATLKFRGQTVKIKKDTGWMPDITSLSYAVKKSGWYTLYNGASRYYPEIAYPAGMLSTTSTVTYGFHLTAKSTTLAPVYAVQLVPSGLDNHNRAKPNSTTNVPVKLTRKSWSDLKAGKNPTVKSVTAKMSTDSRTWKSVPVKKINGVWTVVVKNPASGFVSLRVREASTTGDYTEVTIYRAYAV